MGWIERQATEAWAPEEEGVSAQAAVDFLTVHIKPIPVPAPPYLENGEPELQWSHMTEPMSTTTGQSARQAPRYGRGHERYMGEPSTSSNERVQRKRQRTRDVRERRGDVGS